MLRLLYFIFFAFIFSCTIIEDSDITSQKELDNLQFKSIEITQKLSSGTQNATGFATDSVLDVTTPTGKLNKQIKIQWPEVSTNSKLKYRSGITSGIYISNWYYETGKIYNSVVFVNNVAKEIYSFRYDANGRLNKIITRVPHVNLGPATSNDTLIYKTNGELASITRKYPATGTIATFTNLNYQTSDNSSKLNTFIFQGMEYVRPCSGGGCPQWGGNYHVSPAPANSNFPAGVMNLATFQREYLSMQDFNSINQNNCGSTGCDAWIDTFYFHPLMILKDQFDAGNDLLFIYMVDWWQPISTQESTTDEKVTFSFKYDL